MPPLQTYVAISFLFLAWSVLQAREGLSLLETMQAGTEKGHEGFSSESLINPTTGEPDKGESSNDVLEKLLGEMPLDCFILLFHSCIFLSAYMYHLICFHNLPTCVIFFQRFYELLNYWKYAYKWSVNTADLMVMGK